MKTIKITDIGIDGETQQREKINLDIVSEYAEAMRCGAKFPAVTLFFDGVQYWLADGFHRYHATRDIPALDILADVHEGTKRDAKLFSAGANGIHGQRLTNAEKRKSVLVLLHDKEWREWSDNQIAKHCHVTHPFVGKLRNENVPNGLVTVTTPPNNPLITKEEKNEEISTEVAIKSVEHGVIDGIEEHEEPEYTELDAAHDQIADLQTIIAAGFSAPLPEDQAQATEYINSLHAEIKTLRATLAAVTISRDTLMTENASIKRQCLSQARKLKKYEGGGNVK